MQAKALELTLAVVLGLVTHFQDGLEHLAGQRHAEAVAAFTKVIDADPGIHDLQDLARVYRADAYLALEQKDKALQDLAQVATTTTRAAHRTLAQTRYLEAGGTREDLRPEIGPSATMQALLDALRAGDYAKAKARMSGGVLQIIGIMDQMHAVHGGRGFLQEMAREVDEFAVLGETFDDTNRTARLTTTMEGATIVFGLDQADGAWTLSTVEQFTPRHQARAVAIQPAPEHADLNKLRQLDAAIEQVTMANGAPPARLADAAAYVRDFADVSVSALDHKPFVFAIPAKGGQPWVFTATPVNGTRYGRINGTVTAMPEADFRTLARTHGITVRGAWEAVPLSAEETQRIEALIAQLGAASYAERQEARKALKAVGDKAGPLLDKATKHPDPEIAFQAGQLLEEL